MTALDDASSISTIRVLVVDDHPVFRMGMIALLSSIAGLSVIGEAATVEEAVSAVQSARPDVVVMDLHLGDESGIDATRRILADQPGVGILAVTMMDDDDSVFAAMRAGARGYLLKGASPDDIERAIHAVARGEVLLGPQIAARAIGFLTGSHAADSLAFPQLTSREREVLDLVARGLDNTSISRRLTLSPKTVRNHLSNVFTKLQVPDRSQAIVRAREAGLGRVD
ncbi:response regulator [Ilumatobacter nonamiensis]|uniref:response regulator n=1 Tax=Ilumatobacter nonamiensis TaxID=467093 RepID=UPI00034913D2|nr:response regulator transcription factor [Ilumatobacter nonamiensis]